MYRVFNMGIGFCVILPNEPGAISQVSRIAGEHGVICKRIGTVVDDEAKRVFLTQKGLVQDDLFFTKQA